LEVREMEVVGRGPAEMEVGFEVNVAGPSSEVCAKSPRLSWPYSPFSDRIKRYERKFNP
jgi:hypothetical protein